MLSTCLCSRLLVAFSKVSSLLKFRFLWGISSSKCYSRVSWCRRSIQHTCLLWVGPSFSFMDSMESWRFCCKTRSQLRRWSWWQVVQAWCSNKIKCRPRITNSSSLAKRKTTKSWTTSLNLRTSRKLSFWGIKRGNLPDLPNESQIVLFLHTL